MMKSWTRLCFLVAVVSLTSRAQDDKREIDSPLTQTEAGTTTAAVLTPTPTPSLRGDDPTAPPTPTSPDPRGNATHPPATNVTEWLELELDGRQGDSVSNTSGEDASSTEAPGVTSATSAPSATSATSTSGVAEVSPTTENTASNPVAADENSSSWGYVVLSLIIVVIIILCVILYFLRRASRMYSFDLHRPEPIANQFNEPIGTFEPVYLDDLERPAPKDPVTSDDPSPPPVVNGTTLPSEEKASSGDNAPQDQPDAKGLVETSSTSNTSPSSGSEDPADKTSNPTSTTDLFFDAPGEMPQNENNNNPSICSTDPFVEINLDDPEWCDHLLAPAEATSSVLPFTPFSFSTSSSS